ncbi:MAG: hypothetical protein OEW71_02785, partial [Candidatus Bathyarchaeota archaeon]|nr:hypothetical protein [Candidatus Bathyarchaeota archaeon]
ENSVLKRNFFSVTKSTKGKRLSDKLLLFDDFAENAGFVNFNGRRIQPEFIEQFNELVTADSSGSKTVLAHNRSITSLLLIYLPYKTKPRLPSKPFQTSFPYLQRIAGKENNPIIFRHSYRFANETFFVNPKCRYAVLNAKHNVKNARTK